MINYLSLPKHLLLLGGLEVGLAVSIGFDESSPSLETNATVVRKTRFCSAPKIYFIAAVHLIGHPVSPDANTADGPNAEWINSSYLRASSSARRAPSGHS